MTAQVALGGVEARIAGATLTVDLDALARNWKALARLAGTARAAGIVKADAYGLGIDRVVPALRKAGCADFFVALAHEGIAVRRSAPDARIFVLNGLFSPEAAAAHLEHGLVPVINSVQEAMIWQTAGSTGATPAPCAIHVDTGMNRLGMSIGEARSLSEETALTGALNPILVMSHLACADTPAHPLNRSQLESFESLAGIFEGIERSLCNSAGTFLGRVFHHHLIRPGIAVYGGAPVAEAHNPMKVVATAEARVVQVRTVRAGETIGYGAPDALARDRLVAVIAAGYADGYLRSGSGAGVPLRKVRADGGFGFIKGRRVPVLGRVTMDLTMFDVSELGPHGVRSGDLVELFGANIPLDEAAAAAGTIAYEMLTSLGRRYHRIYVGGGDGNG